MANLNRVTLIGRLGKDVEFKELNNGNAVANLQVATTSVNYNKETREKSEETDWHKVVVWNDLAKNCSRFLKKGSQIYIEGRNKLVSYEKDGEKRYFTEVRANTVQFLDKKSQD